LSSSTGRHALPGNRHAVSAIAFFKCVYDLITAAAKAPTALSKDPREELAIVTAAFSVQLIQILIASIAAIIGYGLFSSARTAGKQVIPREDRAILTALIKEEKEKGIDQYIRLSSLIGATGFFTRLGLAGLPLATIGLTLIFTALSFWGTAYLDLAKLTLGAFIGSYVQRQATPGTGGGPNIPRAPLA
jgi:hypothetical protein